MVLPGDLASACDAAGPGSLRTPRGARARPPSLLPAPLPPGRAAGGSLRLTPVNQPPAAPGGMEVRSECGKSGTRKPVSAASYWEAGPEGPRGRAGGAGGGDRPQGHSASFRRGWRGRFSPRGATCRCPIGHHRKARDPAVADELDTLPLLGPPQCLRDKAQHRACREGEAPSVQLRRGRAPRAAWAAQPRVTAGSAAEGVAGGGSPVRAGK